jgi:hypothetical protein
VTSEFDIQLFLDLADESIDLTPLFYENMPCGGRIEDVTQVFSIDYDRETIVIRGEAVGRCHSESRWSANFQMSLSVRDSDLFVDLDKSHIRYFDARF